MPTITDEQLERVVRALADIQKALKRPLAAHTSARRIEGAYFALCKTIAEVEESSPQAKPHLSRLISPEELNDLAKRFKKRGPR